MSRIRIAAAVIVIAVLAGCGTYTALQAQHPVERMYVIECGENHVKDLSRWTPGVNVGKAHVFSDHCYLIKHSRGWFLWDSGNSDSLAALPNGRTAPNGIITAFMRKPLVESLKELGLDPKDIRYFAMSHSHGDHSGNANLFPSALLYIQNSEYAALFGPDAQKFNLPVANVEKLRDAQTEKLNGDHDVFGDGTVVIKSTPGHTPGHQSLLVRLKKRGPVLLTGDMVHLVYSWDKGIVPSFNYNVEQSRQSIAAMKAFVKETGAQVWVSHDKEQHSLIPKSPNYVD
jgi:glyoxylase-like metal-dependent hydrolase (beta-lactamase superfamily II)